MFEQDSIDDVHLMSLAGLGLWGYPCLEGWVGAVQ